MNARVFPVLIRREFWEHRVLWMAPLIMAALYLLICCVPGGIHFGDLRVARGAGDPAMFVGVQLVFVGLLYAVMSIVVFFYLSEALYTERKDRSILFWKSLPVSDSATVLSKLLVAALVVPLGIDVLALLTNLLAFGILTARFHSNPVLAQFVQWDTATWLRLNLVLLTNTFVLALWFAPLAAYQLLVSAWAKGSVLVWTILPPLLLICAERLIFGTWTVARLLGQRLGAGLFASFGRTPGGVTASVSSTSLLDRIDSGALLATPDLWIGVAVAAVFVFATIRIRRYRDDT